MKVLVVFGSKSDEKVFSKLALKLKEENIDFELKIISAHRNLKELEKRILLNDFDVVLAGAGLSAALPGVISALTVKPVFGLPLNSAYSGLDSLLSIHQMPSGIPVIALGVENFEEFIYFLKKINSIEKIVLIKRKSSALHNNVLLKAINTLKQLNKKTEIIDKKTIKQLNNAIAIELIELKEKDCFKKLNEIIKFHKKKNNIPLFVPIIEKSSAIDAIKLLKLTKKGLWFGLNNSKNAVLAALSFFKENHYLLKKARKER